MPSVLKASLVVVDVQELDGDAPAYAQLGNLDTCGNPSSPVLVLHFNELIARPVYQGSCCLNKRLQKKFTLFSKILHSAVLETGGGIRILACWNCHRNRVVETNNVTLAVHATSTNPRFFVLSID